MITSSDGGDIIGASFCDCYPDEPLNEQFLKPFSLIFVGICLCVKSGERVYFMFGFLQPIKTVRTPYNT